MNSGAEHILRAEVNGPDRRGRRGCYACMATAGLQRFARGAAEAQAAWNTHSRRKKSKEIDL